MKTYPKYKDSNIPWIGRIPGHWKVIKYKHIACIKSGDPISVYDLSENACYPVFGGGKLIGYVNKYNVSDVILIGRVGSCGSITNIREKSWATDNALVLETKKNKNYIYYILLASDLKSLIGTNAQPLITAGKILNYCIPYTFQKEEQQSIAAYLDKKCSAIDRVIEAESRIIEKLREYRQSLITEAVSHGLNPHAPMKASSIPWIGRIPRHWGICKLKDYALICNGQDYKSVADDNGAFPVIGSGGEFARSKEYLYKGESVLLGRKGTIDKPLYINGAFWTVDTMYYTKINKLVCGKYFYYLCNTIPFDFYQYGSAVPSMTQRDLYSVSFPYPPLSEQISIADFLDKKCSAIDSTISKKQQIIEKMTEYKKSLIYECVTGKLSI